MTSTTARRPGISAPPQLLVLGGVASVQFGAAFANELFPTAGPSGVTLLRLLFGAVVLLALVRPTLRGRSRRDLATAVLFGLMLAGMNWTFYQALSKTPLGPAVTVEFIGPLAVAIIGSRRRLDAVWVLLAGGGVAILGLTRHESGTSALHPAGLGLAALAGVFWAGYIVMSKRVGAAMEGLDGLATAMLVATVLVVPMGIVGGGHHLLRVHVLGIGFAVAMLSSVIPYSLELLALRRLSTAAFGLLMSMEPAVAALAGALILHQSLAVPTMLAIVMVIAASAGSTVTAAKSAPAPVTP